MTPGSPHVTVVVPAYEAGDVVRTAVASVLAQTYTDLEVLVVDDGSVRLPVPEDLSDDPRVRVARQERNGGYSHVTNVAVGLARGEWVSFVDADDAVEPTWLAGLVEAGEKYHADAVFAPVRCIRDGLEVGVQWWSPPGVVSDNLEAMRRLLRNDVSGSQHLLLRRPVADSPEDIVYSDWVFLLRHLSRSAVVAYAQEAGYLYTIHGGSVSGGLHPTVWSLRDMVAAAEPLVHATFPADEADALVRDARTLAALQMMHKASRERRHSALRDEVTAWVRGAVSAGDIAALARHGHYGDAASMALAKVSPPLHRWAYRTYDVRKTRRAR